MESIPSISVADAVSQVKNLIMKYKKTPCKKTKKMRCPQYGCWKGFARFEELQGHILESHDWMKAKGLKPLPDGRFQISEQILRTVLR